MVAVIVALPLALAVTSPDDETLATLVLLDDQSMVYVASEGVTLAVSFFVSPFSMVRDAGLRVMLVGVTFTVTLHVALRLVPLIDAVMVAVPLAFAVTSPVDEIVATLVLPDVQLMVYVASEGVTLAVSFFVSPFSMVSVVGVRVMLVGVTFTVTLHVALRLVPLMVAVIVALPLALAVTSPDDETLATLVLLDDQSMVYVASEGVTLAVSFLVSPFSIVRDVGLRVMLSGNIAVTMTSIIALACVWLSVMVTILCPAFSPFIMTFWLSILQDTFALFVAHV